MLLPTPEEIPALKERRRTMALKLLMATKQVLLTDGWRKGAFGARGEPHCLRGAMIQVGFLEDNQGGSTGLAAMMAAGAEYPLTSWNDAPGRTEDEVHEMLDRAIRDLEERRVP